MKTKASEVLVLGSLTMIVGILFVGLAKDFSKLVDTFSKEESDDTKVEETSEVSASATEGMAAV